eukprot:14526189-Alexandrium_andersonii.AAC.1
MLICRTGHVGHSALTPSETRHPRVDGKKNARESQGGVAQDRGYEVQVRFGQCPATSPRTPRAEPARAHSAPARPSRR